jgi:hypothetical protein
VIGPWHGFLGDSSSLLSDCLVGEFEAFLFGVGYEVGLNTGQLGICLFEGFGVLRI